MQDIAKPEEPDPELKAIVRSFSRETFAYGNMEERTRYLVILAALTAQGSRLVFQAVAERALRAGVSASEIKECVYQAAPYVGIGKVFEILTDCGELLSAADGDRAAVTEETRCELGLRLQKSIFGEAIDRAYESAPADERHVQRYLSENCFGDYYTRAGLDVATRELLTFSMLAALGAEPQLKGHIRGNLRVGNGRQTLLTAATVLIPYIGYPRTLNALACIRETAGPESAKNI